MSRLSGHLVEVLDDSLRMLDSDLLVRQLHVRHFEVHDPLIGAGQLRTIFRYVTRLPRCLQDLLQEQKTLRNREVNLMY